MSTKKILALDIGGSKMMAAVVNVEEASAGNPMRFQLEQTVKTTLSEGCTKETLFQEIRKLLDQLPSLDRCEAVGANVPGLADPKRGMWVFAPFSGIRNVPIVQELQNMLGPKPIAIENDVNACALAEKLFGVCTDVDDFLWITVSNGIGGGLVLGGEIYHGHFGNAGEIGHFHVLDDGALCGCGNRGCLEAEAAGPAIARRYARLKARERGEEFSEQQPVIVNVPTVKIAELARNGDPLAKAAFEEAGELIGRAAAYAANLINPAKIVLGGGVSGAFDLLYPGIARKFQEQSFRSANNDVRIEKTALGYEAALIGAAAVGFQR